MMIGAVDIFRRGAAAFCARARARAAARRALPHAYAHARTLCGNEQATHARACPRPARGDVIECIPPFSAIVLFGIGRYW